MSKPSWSDFKVLSHLTSRSCCLFKSTSQPRHAGNRAQASPHDNPAAGSEVCSDLRTTGPVGCGLALGHPHCTCGGSQVERTEHRPCSHVVWPLLFTKHATFGIFTLKPAKRMMQSLPYLFLTFSEKHQVQILTEPLSSCAISAKCIPDLSLAIYLQIKCLCLHLIGVRAMSSVLCLAHSMCL